MKHFLKKAVEKLEGKYYTPKKVVEKLEMNLLIGNPPYDRLNKSGETEKNKDWFYGL